MKAGATTVVLHNTLTIQNAASITDVFDFLKEKLARISVWGYELTIMKV